MSPFALRRLSRTGTSVPPVILALDCFLYKEWCPSCVDRTYDSKKRRYAIYGGSRMKNEILVKYLKAGITPFHLVQQCAADLEAAGFAPLAMEEAWHLEESKKYYINHHGTTILAFTVPKKDEMLASQDNIALRIAAAHTDYPCMRIKTSPDVKTKKYHKLNVEVYGGAILNTWLDRPLGIAGRVALRSDKCLHPQMRLYDSKRPLATIPNLAIHMNREINKGIELNRQADMLPLLGMGEDEDAFMTFLAKELQVPVEDILDFELSIYVWEEPAQIGLREDMISSPRIDNISSCAAIMEAMCQVTCDKHLNIGICYDHEEIGSRTKQGAGSAILTDVIEKIYESMGWTARTAKDAIYQGLMVSADVAHALHPNHVEKADITSQPIMGDGFAIKEAASQSYATDCEAIGIVEQIARANGIAYQKYTNRSDIVGGGTLGAISSALLPMRTIDVGVPMLAMHSARELMGQADYGNLKDLIVSFYGAA